MIERLDNSNMQIAQQIHTVFQRSYSIEADLIGTSEFPPLQRSVEDIAKASTHFYAYFELQSLAAVIEISVVQGELVIESLTVDPNYFKKGIAMKLLAYILANTAYSRAEVETAAVNLPAIALYSKLGFIEFKKWLPSHGIEKVAMSIENTKSSR